MDGSKCRKNTAEGHFGHTNREPTLCVWYGRRSTKVVVRNVQRDQQSARMRGREGHTPRSSLVIVSGRCWYSVKFWSVLRVFLELNFQCDVALFVSETNKSPLFFIFFPLSLRTPKSRLWFLYSHPTAQIRTEQ